MTTACVFVGPSLARTTAADVLPDAHFLPPVQQGDVYRAVIEWRPQVLGIIDGYFQHTPSVWHKEILWALKQGVHVLGAASMGALRAAELEPFGMRGVGKIFAAYRDGTLEPYGDFEDDDEVAVIHGPPDSGFLAVSDAMVNIRLTAHCAEQSGIISTQCRDALVRSAKSLFFAQRTYARAAALTRGNGADDAEIDAFLDWLPNGKVEQKALDAIELLNVIVSNDWYTDIPAFAFEHTEIWQQATLRMPHEGAASPAPSSRATLMEELQLNVPLYRETKRQAAARVLMLSTQATEDSAAHIRRLRAISDRFRRANDLWDRESIDTWLTANDLHVNDFDALMKGESLIEVLCESWDDDLTSHMLDILRLSGHYATLAARARDKHALMQQGSVTRVPEDQLLRWYFETCCGGEWPEDIDTHATVMGFSGRDAFMRALALEHHYVQVTAETV